MMKRESRSQSFLNKEEELKNKRLSVSTNKELLIVYFLFSNSIYLSTQVDLYMHINVMSYPNLDRVIVDVSSCTDMLDYSLCDK